MKLCDYNNVHPLNGDLGMYFRGCYISKVTEDETQVMLVCEVSLIDEEGDPCKLENIQFYGDIWSSNGSNRDSWVGTEVDVSVPLPGYRKIGDSLSYLRYITENRTTKKGIDPRRVHGVDSLNLKVMYQVLNGENLGDLIESEGFIQFRGETVGSRIDSTIILVPRYKSLEEYICQRLGN